jgi:hypothetical protein
METRTVLLTLHIAGVAAWLGANLMQMAVSPLIARKEPAPVNVAWTRWRMWLGQRYYTVAGAWIAITGVLLVLDGDWDWSTRFIWVGIAVIIIGAVTGVVGFAPQMERRIQALESGDGPAADAAERRVVSLAVFDTVLVLLTILAMVDKWGL